MADAEREAFEAKYRGALDLTPCAENDGYMAYSTYCAWRAWKDRGAALASRPAEVDDRTPRPISTAPHDGTEVLAWSITGKTWHQVYWKTQENGDWLFLDPFPPRWACRWNSDYYQGQNEFSHWLPIPDAPSHTSNKEK